MNERDLAIARDLVARARLARDPYEQIRTRPGRWGAADGHGPSAQPTRRELEVLQCMSRGLTREMTAEALGIGVETVRTRLATVRTRLRAKNATQACCEAIRLGLIP